MRRITEGLLHLVVDQHVIVGIFVEDHAGEVAADKARAAGYHQSLQNNLLMSRRNFGAPDPQAPAGERPCTPFSSLVDYSAASLVAHYNKARRAIGFCYC